MGFSQFISNILDAGNSSTEAETEGKEGSAFHICEHSVIEFEVHVSWLSLSPVLPRQAPVLLLCKCVNVFVNINPVFFSACDRWTSCPVSHRRTGISPCSCSDIPQRAQHTSMWLAYLYIQNITLTYTWQTHPVTPLPPMSHSYYYSEWRGINNTATQLTGPGVDWVHEEGVTSSSPTAMSKPTPGSLAGTYLIYQIFWPICVPKILYICKHPLASITLQHLAPQQFHGLLFRRQAGVGTKRYQVSGNPLISLYKSRLQSIQCWESAIILSQTKLCQESCLTKSG